jgi:preprotein translocase subunit SecB
LNANAHIEYKKVTLTELVFELNNKFKLPAKGVRVDIDLSVKTEIKKSKTLVCSLSAELFKNAKKDNSAPFYLRATVEGHFESDEKTALKSFAAVNAPAHLLPFMRELIANTTMRASVPPLFIPPLNIKSIVDHIEEKKKSAK